VKLGVVTRPEIAIRNNSRSRRLKTLAWSMSFAANATVSTTQTTHYWQYNFKIKTTFDYKKLAVAAK